MLHREDDVRRERRFAGRDRAVAFIVGLAGLLVGCGGDEPLVAVDAGSKILDAGLPPTADGALRADSATSDGAAQMDAHVEVATDASERAPDAGQAPEPFPPDAPGPFAVGTRELPWHDSARGGEAGRDVTTRLWYPARPAADAAPVRYRGILDGGSYDGAEPDRSRAPYPVVLFSHGNRGINFQSFTTTERLASHGFVVVAPNHQGNTIFDDANDEQLGQVALERPGDLAFALSQIAAMDADPAFPLAGLADTARAAVVGHSFGGFTALVLAGGTVDVDAALARCDAGVENDVFCDSLRFWPRGEIISRPAGLEAVLAAVALAPGGYAAFGDAGLAEVTMPTLVMGGTLDEFTHADLRPIYDALPPPAMRIEIAGMGHMGFTDICRAAVVPLIPDLVALCDPEVFIDVDRGFAVVDPFIVAWIRRHLNGEAAMDRWLSAEFAATFPEVERTAK